MDFTSKFSLYDILAMVIPGGATLLFLQGVLSISHLPLNQSVDFLFTKDGWPVGLTMSYIVGLGMHSLSNIIWSGFRNNPIRLKKQLGKVKSEVGETEHLDKLYKGDYLTQNEEISNSSDYVKAAYWLLTCIWMVYGVLSVGAKAQISFDRLHTPFLFINVCFIIVFYIILTSKICFNINVQEQKITRAYYKAYYYVQQKSKHCNIFTIEGQIAFLQSMFIPLSLLLCLPNEMIYKINIINNNICGFYMKDLLLLVCSFTYPIVISRIDKVHYLVWYDYEFLKEIKE